MSKKVLLLILDGWGITQNDQVSAIAQANTPYIDSLYNTYPHSQLITHGESVGLPEGQMGNSEVGHMNLGAGRIVYQDFARINKSVEDGSIAERQQIKTAFAYAKKENKNVHFIGLVSQGGVHSHLSQLKGLLKAAKLAKVDNVFVHAFTDGRDVDPKSAVHDIDDLLNYMKATTGKLATIVGRYFAMDRDKRWERIKKAYDLLVHNNGSECEDAIECIKESYSKGITDEFLEPIVLTENGVPVSSIKKGDVVIFFNFRTDRGRQLTEALTQQNYEEYGMNVIPLHFVTMTNYDQSFKGLNIIFSKEDISNTLGETIAKAGKSQIRIAETEKYPHVTFFFNGGRELPFKDEKRILCPSPKVATYDLQPEMSAYDIRDAILPEIKKGSTDFICLNFANPDMVGHTGVMQAAIEACEAVDKCVKSIVETAKESGYSILLIADHGNCEVMRNEDGSPNTAHTVNPVPLILIDKDHKKINPGILGDIAPTVLELLDIDKPTEMTQNSLL